MTRPLDRAASIGNQIRPSRQVRGQSISVLFLIERHLDEFGDSSLVARTWHWVLHGGGRGPISHMDWSRFDGDGPPSAATLAAESTASQPPSPLRSPGTSSTGPGSSAGCAPPSPKTNSPCGSIPGTLRPRPPLAKKAQSPSPCTRSGTPNGPGGTLCDRCPGPLPRSCRLREVLRRRPAMTSDGAWVRRKRSLDSRPAIHDQRPRAGDIGVHGRDQNRAAGQCGSGDRREVTGLDGEVEFLGDGVGETIAQLGDVVGHAQAAQGSMRRVSRRISSRSRPTCSSMLGRCTFKMTAWPPRRRATQWPTCRSSRHLLRAPGRGNSPQIAGRSPESGDDLSPSRR
jgi:hypothetical protein